MCKDRMQNNLYGLERKFFQDTLLDSRIIWVEFMSVEGGEAHVPVSAGLSKLPLWSHTDVLPTSLLPSLTNIIIVMESNISLTVFCIRFGTPFEAVPLDNTTGSLKNTMLSLASRTLKA